MKDRTDGLQETAAERAEKEVADITAILTELRQAIQGQLDDPYYQENYLPGFAPAEQEQFERNVDALRRRLTEIPGKSRKRPRRSGHGLPTRSRGCSPWR